MTEKEWEKMTPEEQFKWSIRNAEKSGVPEEKILRTKEDIDRYFQGSN